MYFSGYELLPSENNFFALNAHSNCCAFHSWKQKFWEFFSAFLLQSEQKNLSTFDAMFLLPNQFFLCEYKNHQGLEAEQGENWALDFY